jgi:hypothetical protein
MSEDIKELAGAGAAVPEPAPRTNRGWFKSGDPRINRQGRPWGSKADVPEGTHPEDCAPRADRLRRLVVLERDLVWRLASIKAPGVANLPTDFQVVASRFDAARRVVVFVIRSDTFPRVARGAPIPEFEPTFDGLLYRRKG